MRDTVANRVANTLKERILNGTYREGEKIPPENILCRELNVSRTSLREGIRSLEAAGYVELLPGKGSFVAEPLPPADGYARNLLISREFDFKDLLYARKAIEPICAELAAQRITQEDKVYLNGLLYQFEQAYHKQDFDELVNQDMQLHLKIAELSGNELLLSFLRILQERYTVYCRSFYFVENNGVDVLALHPPLLESIIAGKPKEARARMEAHIDQIFYDLERIK